MSVHTQVYISYLEIYNEVGYDLLDPTREVQAMEDLPQVIGGLEPTPQLPTVLAPAATTADAAVSAAATTEQPLSSHTVQ